METFFETKECDTFIFIAPASIIVKVFILDKSSAGVTGAVNAGYP